MAILDGFGAMVVIREQRINSLLAGLQEHYGNRLRVTAGFSVNIGGSTVSVSGIGYLASAQVSLHENPSNYARVDLRSFARVTIDLQGASPQTAVDTALELRVTADVPITFLPAQSVLIDKGVLDIANFVLQSTTIQIHSPAVPSDIQTIVLSEPFRTALANVLRKVSSDYLRISLPTSNLFLAQLQTIQYGVLLPVIMPRAVKIMEGALAIVCDKTDQFSDPRDLNAVALPWQKFDEGIDALAAAEPTQHYAQRSDAIDIAVVVSSGLLKEALELNLLLVIYKQATNPSFKLESRTATFLPGKIHLDIHAKQNAPDPFPGEHHVHLTLDAVALMIFSKLRVVPRDVHSYIDGPDIFGIFTSQAEAELEAKITGPAAAPWLDVSYHGIVPGLPPLDPEVPAPAEFALQGLRVGIGLAGVSVLPEQTIAGGKADTYRYTPDLTISVTDTLNPAFQTNSVHISSRYLVYRAVHPELKRNPALRLHWQILDAQGNVRTEMSGWADTICGPHTLDLWTSQAVYPLRGFRLRCIVTLGTTTLWETSQWIEIRDVLDRSHPYVHHSRTVEWYRYKEVNSRIVREVAGSKFRRSAIHKTAYPGRCRFADKFRSMAHSIEYLDSLPTPIGQPVDPSLDTGNYSIRLCPYCFYGSPQKAPKRLSRYLAARINRHLVVSGEQP